MEDEKNSMAKRRRMEHEERINNLRRSMLIFNKVTTKPSPSRPSYSINDPSIYPRPHSDDVVRETRLLNMGVPDDFDPTTMKHYQGHFPSASDKEKNAVDAELSRVLRSVGVDEVKDFFLVRHPRLINVKFAGSILFKAIEKYSTGLSVINYILYQLKPGDSGYTRSLANAKDPRIGQYVIHEAMDQNRLDVVATLVMAGANVDQKTGRGRTPLMLAVSNENWAGCQMMIEFGASMEGVEPLLRYKGPANLKLLEVFKTARPLPGITPNSTERVLKSLAAEIHNTTTWHSDWRPRGVVFRSSEGTATLSFFEDVYDAPYVGEFHFPNKKKALVHVWDDDRIINEYNEGKFDVNSGIWCSFVASGTLKQYLITDVDWIPPKRDAVTLNSESSFKFSENERGDDRAETTRKKNFF